MELQRGAAKVRVDRIINLYMVKLLNYVSAESPGKEEENITQLACGFIGDSVQVAGEERF